MFLTSKATMAVGFWVNDQLLIDKWQSQSLTTMDKCHHACRPARVTTSGWNTSRIGGAAQVHLYVVQPEPAEGSHSEHVSLSDKQLWPGHFQCAVRHDQSR